jgi:hypothetical protein
VGGALELVSAASQTLIHSVGVLSPARPAPLPPGIPLARRRKEPFERLQQRVSALTEAFAPYDWTRQLANA